MNRQQVVESLGSMLEQAARSSVAKGAFYEPGENINRDSQAAWAAVAEVLVKLVESVADRVGPKDQSETTDVERA